MHAATDAAGYVKQRRSFTTVRSKEHLNHTVNSEIVVADRTMGVSLSLSPAIARTGARMARSQLSYSLASLKSDSACRWNALQASEYCQVLTQAAICMSVQCCHCGYMVDKL